MRQIKLQPHQLTDPVTAAKDMFVLTHLGVPRVDPLSWRLKIDGLIGRKATFDLAQLKTMRRTTIEAVHELLRQSPRADSADTARRQRSLDRR